MLILQVSPPSCPSPALQLRLRDRNSRRRSCPVPFPYRLPQSSDPDIFAASFPFPLLPAPSSLFVPIHPEPGFIPKHTTALSLPKKEIRPSQCPCHFTNTLLPFSSTPRIGFFSIHHLVSLTRRSTHPLDQPSRACLPRPPILPLVSKEREKRKPLSPQKARKEIWRSTSTASPFRP